MNDRSDAVEQVQRRLKHVFADPVLLERALTHASAHGTKGKARDNEVLEFIGDRVIGLIAAERLAEIYPAAPEGDLAPRLNALVNRKTCADVARLMGLGPALRLSGSETKTGGREEESILAGACEAVMAAIYQDGGLDAARAVFLDLWRKRSTPSASPGPATPRPPCRSGRKGRASRCPPIRWSPARALTTRRHLR